MLLDKFFLAVQEGRFRQSRVLRPLSHAYSIGARIKNWLYDRNYLSSHRLPAVVISVGNLVAGGSGKTPLIHLLSQTLMPLGLIAILSRGYLAKKSNLALGDELTMLSHLLPEILPFANQDRIASGEQAIEIGARLILLDDGLQYRKLHRDIDLVIVDAKNPFGYGAFLPCGLLRDHPSRLSRADALFVNGECSGLLYATLRKWTLAPIISVKMHYERLLDIDHRPVDSSQIQKVGAFCAIGQPQRFLQTLHEAHYDVVHHWFIKDHEKPDPNELIKFAKKCQQLGASCLLCTHKDAVKIKIDFAVSLPIYYLEMQLKVISGIENWQNLIEKIRLKLNN